VAVAQPDVVQKEATAAMAVRKEEAEATYPLRPVVGSSDVFLRNATGLVRELSGFDGFVVGFGQLNVLLGLTEAFAFGLFLFPGANLTVAFAIAVPTVLFFGLVYAMLTTSMPRSGGDYVWVSRLLSPAVGFAVNFYITFVVLAWAALNATLIPAWFLPPLFHSLGLQSWVEPVQTNTGRLLIGTALIVLYTGLLMYGVKRLIRVMVLLFWVVSAGTILWFGLMLFPQTHIAAALQSSWHASTSSVITAAANNGFASTANHLRNSFYGIIFGITGFLGFQMTAYFAGEIKGARRSGSRAIMVAWGLGAVGFLVGSVLIYHVYGSHFLASINYLYNNAPTKYHLPLAPFLPSLALLLTTNRVLQTLVSLSFLLTMLWIIPTSFVFASRNMFAWSFDRVMPSWLAEVNDRTHSPLNVAIVSGVVTELLLLATIYTSFWARLVNLTGVLAICFLLVSVAAIVFPYRRPDIFAKAPAWVQRKVGSVYLIVIIGAISAVSWIVVAYIAWTTPAIGGAVSWSSFLYSAAAFLVAFPIYWVARYYHRRTQDLDIGKAFSEIPPE
jgi:basic amino acid/polyamine antiporter, APA family